MINDEKELLKRCPFCGSRELELCRTKRYAYWIRCGKCTSDGENSKLRSGAINNWNRRASFNSDFSKFNEAYFIFDDEKEESQRAERRRRRKRRLSKCPKNNL